MALANPKPDESGEVKCYACAIRFAVASDILAAWKKSGQTFYCPNGHGQCFGGGEIEQLKGQLEQAQADFRQAEQTAAAHRQRWQQAETRANQERDARLLVEAEKNELLERTCSGKCPFCSREFQNLQKHVAARHPDRKSEPDKPQKRRAPRRKAALNTPGDERTTEV